MNWKFGYCVTSALHLEAYLSVSIQCVVHYYGTEAFFLHIRIKLKVL